MTTSAAATAPPEPLLLDCAGDPCDPSPASVLRRLTTAIELLGMDTDGAAAYLRIRRPTMTRILSGLHPIPISAGSILRRRDGVSLDWLYLGIGEPFIPGAGDPAAQIGLRLVEDHGAEPAVHAQLEATLRLIDQLDLEDPEALARLQDYIDVVRRGRRP